MCLNHDNFRRLVVAICKYGLDNVTVLADHCKLPVETARYMIWNELPRHGISVGVEVDFEAMGLEQFVVKVTATRKPDREVIASFFDDEIGLNALLFHMISDSIVFLCAVPKGQHLNLERILNYLANSGIITSYEMKKIMWLNYKSLDPSYFDFRKGIWTVDWKAVELESIMLKVDERERSDPSDYFDHLQMANFVGRKVDMCDLLILRALQRKVPRSISKLERSIGSDQHSLRYHYKKHVKPLVKRFYLKFQSGESRGDSQNLVLFTYKPKEKSDYVEALRIVCSFPFTVVEWNSLEEYSWLVRLPNEFASPALKYLDHRTSRLPGSLTHSLIDSASELSRPFTSQLFDSETSSWKYEPKKSQLFALQ